MIAQKQIDYAKEADDVMVLMVDLLKQLKAKKPISEIAALELPNLMNAMDGMNQIDDEAKNKKVLLQTVGYRLGELADVFIEPSAPSA